MATITRNIISGSGRQRGYIVGTAILPSAKGGNLEFISIISVGTNGALYVERLQRKRGFTMGLLVGNSDLTSSLLPPRLGFARAHRLPGRANWEEFGELLTNMDASSPGGSSYKCYRSALFSLLTYAGMNSSNMVEK